MWSVSVTPGGENIVRLYVNHMTTKYKLEETSRSKQLTYRNLVVSMAFPVHTTTPVVSRGNQSQETEKPTETVHGYKQTSNIN